MISPEIGTVRTELAKIGMILPETLSTDELKKRFIKQAMEAQDPIMMVKWTRALLQLSAMIDPDSVDGFLGIRIVERSKNRPEQDDCFTYWFGHNADARQITEDMLLKYDILDEPVAGAYVLYLTTELDPRHIGKITESGTVISKWGLHAHVYEHLPILAPLNYGPNVVYVSPIDGNSLSNRE